MRHRALQVGFLLALLIGSAVSAATQTGPSVQPKNNPAGYKYAYGPDNEVEDLINTSPSQRTDDQARLVLRIGRGTNTTKLLFKVAGYDKFLQQVENFRQDLQLGSDPSSQGTTTIVSKGVAAQVLSLATQYGAVAQTTSQTTSTFRVNFLGIARLLNGNADQFPYCAVYDYKCESNSAKFLRSISAGISFYTNPSTTPPAGSSGNQSTLQVSSKTVAGWNAKYDFHVKRKDIYSGYAAAYEKGINDSKTNLSASAVAFTLAVNIFNQELANSDLYRDWLAKYTAKLGNDNGDQIKGDMQSALDDLSNIVSNNSKLKGEAQDALSKMSDYFANRDKILGDYLNTVTFSLEYNNNRPISQPTLSTARFILSAHPSSFQLTANAAVQWYDQILQSNVSRLRSAQAAVQFDRQFGKPDSAIMPTVSAGYYFQYMVANALLTLPSSAFAPGTTIPLPGNASELLNTKGAINIGQVKATFRIRNTGINFPIALTFSNRTELIKASDVRGNFGITYDLDSLFVQK
jgi:hypothetical protein